MVSDSDIEFEREFDSDPFPNEGFRTFEVSHTLGDKIDQKLVSVTVRATYDFGRTVDLTSMVEPIATAQQFIEETVVAKYDEMMERERAQHREQIANVVPLQPVAAGPPAAAPSSNPVGRVPATHHSSMAVGNKPQGKGQVRYVPTSVISPDTFRTAVHAAIKHQGYNPADFTVYDNRRNLEAGQQQWSVGRVVGADGTAYARGLDGKSAFFIDFEENGTIKVTPTNEMRNLVAAMRAMSSPNPDAWS